MCAIQEKYGPVSVVGVLKSTLLYMLYGDEIYPIRPNPIHPDPIHPNPIHPKNFRSDPSKSDWTGLDRAMDYKKTDIQLTSITCTKI